MGQHHQPKPIAETFTGSIALRPMEDAPAADKDALQRPQDLQYAPTVPREA